MIGYPLLNYLAIFALDLSKFEFVLRFFKYVVRYLITCHSSQFIPSTLQCKYYVDHRLLFKKYVQIT